MAADLRSEANWVAIFLEDETRVLRKSFTTQRLFFAQLYFRQKSLEKVFFNILDWYLWWNFRNSVM